MVTSLVIGPNGEVVIAETGAATLTTFNPSTDTFGVLTIPQVGEVQALAASSDGTIAVAMSERHSDGSFVNDLVVVIHPDGTQTDVAAPSSWIGSAGSEFVMGDLGQVSTAASSSTAGTAAMAADLLNGQHSNFDLNVAAVLPDGSVAIATTTGIDIVANGAVQQTIALPQWACAGAWNPPPGDTQTPPTTCQETPTHIVVDRSGNIWVSPDQPQNELGLIPTS
jgi:streptogramin lyase